MTRSFLLAAILLSPAFALADTESADAAYRRGQAALKAGRIHEACDALAASDKLEPRIETELSLADCYEQDGKVIAASRLYRTLADKDTNPARAKKASAKATQLEAKAPRLRFAINPRPDGLVIRVDGEVVPSSGDVRVDIGTHEVIATAPGFEGHASPAVDGARPILDVIIRMEPKAEAAQPEASAPASGATATATPPASGAAPAPAEPMASIDARPDHRKRNGVIVAGAGAGLVVGAGVLFGLAASKFGTEHDLCPDARCASPTDLARANALLDNGTTLRDVGIGLGIGGVALIAVGGYLLLTPHREAPRVSVHAGHGMTGVSFSGSF